jgi:xylan 1,4-beta-xylosidase
MKRAVGEISFQLYKNTEQPIRLKDGLLLFFGLTGKGRIYLAGSEYKLLPAGMLLVNPLDSFRINCDSETAILELEISRSYLQHFVKKNIAVYSLYVSSGENRQPVFERVRRIYASIFEAYLQEKREAASSMASSVRELLDVLDEKFSLEGNGTEDDLDSVRRLRRILDVINEHWNEEISLERIARDEYLSQGYLSRFFKNHMHMTFSAYLREIRLQNASMKLKNSASSVTHIAYDCGFRTPGVFIDAFRKYYGVTPGVYRQKYREKTAESSDDNKQPSAGSLDQAFRKIGAPGIVGQMREDQNDGEDLLSALTRYVYEKPSAELPTVNRELAVHAGRGECEKVSWPRILNVGYARDLLMQPIQDQVRKAQSEIGFDYIRFHGIFDEDMHIYYEDAEGTPHFYFAYAAMVFDFILSVGLIPFVELSFMPSALAREQTKIFDRPSVISGCTDLGKWKQLVQAMIRFLIGRYGMSEVLKWRFVTIGKGYAHIGCISVEEHEALFETTWRAIKEVNANLKFGGPGCFAYLIHDPAGMPRFLQFTKEHACIPDFISIQCYPHTASGEDVLFMDYTMSQLFAPSILSGDDDFLRHSLEDLRELLTEMEIPASEIVIEEANSTLWQRDISGDTCYKAAWLAKNVSETRGDAVFGYWLLTDLLEERADIDTMYHGGYGLLTYDGIPKAGYTAMRLISMLGDTIEDAGDGWILTSGRNRRKHRIAKAGEPEAGIAYQLLCWNYCSYRNLYRYRYQKLKKPQDAYSVFEPGKVVQNHYRLSGIPDGMYRMEEYHVTRKNGSSFDAWMDLGSPRTANMDEKRYLASRAEPELKRQVIQVEDGTFLPLTMEPQEIALIVLTKMT